MFKFSSNENQDSNDQSQQRSVDKQLLQSPKQTNISANNQNSSVSSGPLNDYGVSSSIKITDKNIGDSSGSASASASASDYNNSPFQQPQSKLNETENESTSSKIMKKFSKRIRSPSSPGLIPQQFKDITQSSGTNSHSTFHLLPQVSSFRDSRHHSSGTTMTPKTNRSSITDDSSNSLDPFNTADSNNQDPQNIGLDLIQKKQQDNLNNFKGHSAVQLSEADQLQNSDQSASANVTNKNRRC
ncbi:unnamed protein product [[Candida] boidinii]|nr:unnamed protein product [[Candida] boidinii]